MSQSSIKKNTYFVFLGQFVQMALAFFLMFFAARYLGDAGFGKYALASTIMYFVLLGNDLGINIYTTREVARNLDHAQHYFKKALGVKLLIIPADLFVLFLFLYVSPYEKNTKMAIILFAIYGILQSVVQLITSIFRAYQRMQYETIIIITEKILTTSLGVFILLQGWGLLPFCAVFILGGSVSFFLSRFFLKRKFFAPKISLRLSHAKTLLWISIPFGLSMIIANIYNNVGTLILSWFESAQIVGWYSSAFRLVNFTNVIPTVLSIALFPALSVEITRSASKFRELYSRGFKYLFYVALPMVVGTILLADKIVLLVFGEEFVHSIPVLKIMIIGGGLIFFNTYFAWFFNATNHQKNLVYILIAALFINLFLNFILVLEFSYIGASIATVLTELIIFAICYIYIRKRVVKMQEWSFVYRSFLSAVLMAGFLIIFPSLQVLVAIGIASIIYLLSLYGLRGFTLEEILLFKNQRKEVVVEE